MDHGRAPPPVPHRAAAGACGGTTFIAGPFPFLAACSSLAWQLAASLKGHFANRPTRCLHSSLHHTRYGCHDLVTSCTSQHASCKRVLHTHINAHPLYACSISTPQMGIKITNEAPVGIKAGLRASYQWVNQVRPAAGSSSSRTCNGFQGLLQTPRERGWAAPRCFSLNYSAPLPQSTRQLASALLLVQLFKPLRHDQVQKHALTHKTHNDAHTGHARRCGPPGVAPAAVRQLLPALGRAGASGGLLSHVCHTLESRGGASCFMQCNTSLPAPADNL